MISGEGWGLGVWSRLSSLLNLRMGRLATVSRVPQQRGHAKSLPHMMNDPWFGKASAFFGLSKFVKKEGIFPPIVRPLQQKQKMDCNQFHFMYAGFLRGVGFCSAGRIPTLRRDLKELEKRFIFSKGTGGGRRITHEDNGEGSLK